VADAGGELHRELLSNAAQHVAAQRVHAVIERESGSVVLTVSDDGVGFDPEEVLGGSVL
jgi:signal transduction histidine kinase